MTDTGLPSDTEAPIDAEFEPAQPVSTAQKLRMGPGWRAFGLVCLLFLVSAGLILANYGLIPGLKPRGSETEALQARIVKAEADLQARTQSLESLQASVEESLAELNRLNSNIQGVSNAVDSLREDMDALEATPVTSTQAPNPESIDPLIISRLEALEASLANSAGEETNSSGETIVLDDQLTILRAEIDALRADLEQAQQAPAPIPEPVTNTAEAALALSSIEAAARRGRPFLSGYQQLAEALPNQRSVAALAPLAATGAPTLASLNDQFPALERRALDADAEAMGEAAGFMRGIFGDSLKVRRDGEVSSADLLDAASLALESGDLANAIAELEKLTPGPKAVFGDWLEKANGRLTLENTLEALRLTMIAKARP